MGLTLLEYPVELSKVPRSRLMSASLAALAPTTRIVRTNSPYTASLSIFKVNYRFLFTFDSDHYDILSAWKKLKLFLHRWFQIVKRSRISSLLVFSQFNEPSRGGTYFSNCAASEGSILLRNLRSQLERLWDPGLLHRIYRWLLTIYTEAQANEYLIWSEIQR